MRLAGLRLIVVEDDVLIGYDLALALTAEGCEVRGTCTSPEQALAHLYAGPLDVALVDLQLGQETAHPLLATLINRGVPPIVLTGYSAPDLGSLKPLAVFPKPVNTEALIVFLAGLNR